MSVVEASTGTRKGSVRVAVAVAAVATIVFMVGFFPTSTRIGVNYQVREESIPLYLKVFEFLSRDARYRALSRAMVADGMSDEEKVEAIFRWTRANVRPVPPGFPVVDDHPWSIIVRGYGTDDQAADVFTILATYQGLRALMQWAVPPAGGPRLALAAYELHGEWRIADVRRGHLFRNSAGELATVPELRSIARRGRLAGAKTTVQGISYVDYFIDLESVQPPPVLRAEQQMPLARLSYEFRRIIGLVR